MIVFSYGIPKSGSTLAFELSKAILERRGFEQRHLPDDVVAPGRKINFLIDATIPAFDRAIQATAADEIIVVKIHAPLGAAEAKFLDEQAAAGKVKVQVNIRDPREVCLSLVDAGEKARQTGRPAFANIKSLDQAARTVGRQIEACRLWGSVGGALHLFYNDVAFDTPVAARQICAQFGLDPLDDAEFAAVSDHVFNEAFTQRNKAVKDRHLTDLTPEQNDALVRKIDNGREFVERVCMRRDTSWFDMTPAEASPDA